MSCFGSHRHVPVGGLHVGSAPYGYLSFRGTDGMGTTHVAVVVRCRECGRDFDIAMFHTTSAALSGHEKRGRALHSRDDQTHE